MLLRFFFTGLFIGFCIAFPFGGNAILCLRNTLSQGGKFGIFTGLGAATAHATYSLVSLSGLAAVDSLLSQYIGVLECCGGIFLFCFGLYSFRNKIAEIDPVNPTNEEEKGLIKTYILSTLFALTNPKSILATTILILESGVLRISHFTIPLLAISTLGIFLGSSFWWLIFVTFLSLLRQALSYTYLIWLNRAFALVVTGLGLFITVFGFSKIWLLPHSVV